MMNSMAKEEAPEAAREIRVTPVVMTKRNGVPVFAARPGEVVTVEDVERIAEEEGV